MAKYTSQEKIQLVIWNHTQGKSVAEICTILNIKRRTVYNILKRFTHENRIDLKHGPGRPKRLTLHEERLIMRKVKLNPRVSAPTLVSELYEECGKKVGRETVRRTIRNAGYNGRVARRKPFISEVNRRKRLKFAKEYVSKPITYWEDVIYADESKFNIHGSDGRCMVWRERNKELDPRNLKATVKHGGGGHMVWGCVSAHGVGNLVFIDGILNSGRYLELLQANLRQSAAAMGILQTFKYYEDNDPKHRARIVQEWQLYRCPKVIHPPPQSPDLNIIENLWDELDRRVHQTPVSSKAALKERLEAEWMKFDQEYIRKLVCSMPNRLQCVIDQKGYSTRY